MMNSTPLARRSGWCEFRSFTGFQENADPRRPRFSRRLVRFSLCLQPGVRVWLTDLCSWCRQTREMVAGRTRSFFPCRSKVGVSCRDRSDKPASGTLSVAPRNFFDDDSLSLRSPLLLGFVLLFHLWLRSCNEQVNASGYRHLFVRGYH
jgi:hypothetical protein